jgi:hypothetical protein
MYLNTQEKVGLCSFPNASVHLDRNHKFMIGTQTSIPTNICTLYVRESVSDPHLFHADPDPRQNLNADPDSGPSATKF